MMVLYKHYGKIRRYFMGEMNAQIVKTRQKGVTDSGYKSRQSDRSRLRMIPRPYHSDCRHRNRIRLFAVKRMNAEGAIRAKILPEGNAAG